VLRILAWILNIVLLATGVVQWLKLSLAWAVLAVAVGGLNLLVLYLDRRTGWLARLATFGCAVAVVIGAVLGYRATTVFADAADSSMADLFHSGYDLSYALAYVGAGLVTFAILMSSEREAE